MAKCHRDNQIKEQHGCPLNVGRGHRFLALVSNLVLLPCDPYPIIIIIIALRHIPSSRPLAVPQLPYVVETNVPLDELTRFREDTDVQALRNQHNADVVVLVGTWAGICGLA